MGDAGVKKGKLESAGRLGPRGLWAVPGEDHCVSRCPHWSPRSLSLPLLEELGWDGREGGELGEVMKLCGGPEGPGWQTSVSTGGLVVGPSVWEPRSQRPSVHAVPTSSCAKGSQPGSGGCPPALPGHSWGLSQRPNRECCRSCSSSPLSACPSSPPSRLFHPNLGPWSGH